MGNASSELAPDELRVRAYPRPLRAASGGLLGASGLGLVYLAGRALLVTAPRMTAPMALHTFLVVSALPALGAWVVRHVLVARLGIRADRLEVHVGGETFTAPLDAIAAVEPWRVPLPEPGIDLRLRSGERFALGIGADDPAAVVARLEEAGVAAAEGVRARPALLYARVKHEAGPLGWRRLLVKYPLFGVLVGSILFDAHQRIAYGGPFGQWELEGALAWLRTLVAHWAAVTLYLALYASLWRWPAEILAWLAARRGTVLATRVRRLVEVACRVAYYAGVPLLLALLYAQSA